jgi:hypothetical protein
MTRQPIPEIEALRDTFEFANGKFDSDRFVSDEDLSIARREAIHVAMDQRVITEEHGIISDIDVEATLLAHTPDAVASMIPSVREGRQGWVASARTLMRLLTADFKQTYPSLQGEQ